jgi:hypothetical protein
MDSRVGIYTVIHCVEFSEQKLDYYIRCYYAVSANFRRKWTKLNDLNAILIYRPLDYFKKNYPSHLGLNCCVRRVAEK